MNHLINLILFIIIFYLIELYFILCLPFLIELNLLIILIELNRLIINFDCFKFSQILFEFKKDYLPERIATLLTIAPAALRWAPTAKPRSKSTTTRSPCSRLASDATRVLFPRRRPELPDPPSRPRPKRPSPSRRFRASVPVAPSLRQPPVNINQIDIHFVCLIK